MVKLKYTISLLIIAEYGKIVKDLGALIKKEEGSAIIYSQKYKQKLKVPIKCFRKNTVLLTVKEGKLKIVNPDLWTKIKLSNYEIAEVNWNRMNFRSQESVTAMRIWFPKPDIFKKIGTWFTYLLVGLVVGVTIYLTFQYAVDLFSTIRGARLLDCTQLIPKAPLPPDLVNTIPTA